MPARAIEHYPLIVPEPLTYGFGRTWRCDLFIGHEGPGAEPSRRAVVRRPGLRAVSYGPSSTPVRAGSVPRSGDAVNKFPATPRALTGSRSGARLCSPVHLQSRGGRVGVRRGTGLGQPTPRIATGD